MNYSVASIFNLYAPHIFIAIVCAIVLVGILVAVSITDIKTRNIPNIFVLAILLLGIISAVLTTFGYPFPINKINLLERLGGAVIAFAPTFIIGSKIGGIGGGDIKLLSVLGFLFGIEETIIMLLCTCIIGACAGIVKLVLSWIKKGADTTLAYAPYIAVGSIAALCFDLGFFWSAF